MARRKKLRDLCEAEYNDPELASAVFDHAVALKTVEAIERGHSVLPSEQDAIIWRARRDGKLQADTDRNADLQRIAELEKTVAALNAEGGMPSKHYLAELENRIKTIEKR